MAIKRARLSPTAFAYAQLSLLQAEQSAEVEETTLLLSDFPPTTIARAGLAILNLTTISQRTGLGGKTLLELGLDPAVKSGQKGGSDLPEHGIRTGDIVRVGEQPSGGAKKQEKAEMKVKGVEGVVTRVGERAVWVALGKGSGVDEDVDVPNGKLWLYVSSGMHEVCLTKR
jgi:DNA polymerase alpha-associated DNA helicase A